MSAVLVLAALAALGPIPTRAQTAPPSTGDPAVQRVPLELGWNWISLGIPPLSPAIAELSGAALPPIAPVKERLGRAYALFHGASTFDAWAWNEGYTVYPDPSVAFEVESPAVASPGSPIPLRAGWDFGPYLGFGTAPAEAALASVADYPELARDTGGRFYAPDDSASTLDSLGEGGAIEVWLGRADTLVFPPSSPRAPPMAGFTSSCAAPSSAFIDASADSDGDVVAYPQDFGDGTAASAVVSLTHAYAALGTYTVRLDVMDDGASGSYEADVTASEDEEGGPGGFYGVEAVPWGLESELYAATYNDACPAGQAYDGGACTPVEVWLAREGFGSYCYVDDDGSADATSIGGCGYAPAQATIVRAGMYREDIRPTTSRFALVAYPGERPVVSGADVDAPGGWAHRGGGVWRHDWVWTDQDNGNGSYSTSRRRELFVVDGAVLRGLGGETLPTIAEGEFWVEGPPAAPTAVYINPSGDTNPNIASVEVGQRSKLFWPGDIDGHRCEDSSQSGHLVAGMTFRYGTSGRQHFALCLGGSDGALLDSDVSWQNGGAVDLDGDGHVVTGSTFNDNGIEGPGGTGADGLLLAFNEIRRNGWKDPQEAGHGGGGKFTRSVGMVIRNNVYAENYLNGLWIDNAPFSSPKNHWNLVAANLFERNYSANLFIELFSDSTAVLNNVCVENQLEPHEPEGNVRMMGCIKMVNTNANVVAFNTVLDARNFAIGFNADNRSLWPCGHDGDPTCGSTGPPTYESSKGYNEGPADADGSPRRSRGHYAFNNVLMTLDTPTYTNERGRAVAPRANAVWIGGAVGADDEETLTFRNNLYYNKGLGADAQKATFRTDESGIYTDPYATWAAGINDRNGVLFTDPLTVVSATAAAGALTLPALSPARDAGAATPPEVFSIFDGSPIESLVDYYLTHDAFGRLRGASPDVGAVEAQ